MLKVLFVEMYVTTKNKSFYLFFGQVVRDQELCENRGGRPGFPRILKVLFVEMYVTTKKKTNLFVFLFWGQVVRDQELYESRGGRPGLPVPNKPDGFCGRKATLKLKLSSCL